MLRGLGNGVLMLVFVVRLTSVAKSEVERLASRVDKVKLGTLLSGALTGVVAFSGVSGITGRWCCYL